MLSAVSRVQSSPTNDEGVALDAALGALLRDSTHLEPDDLPLAVRQTAGRLGAVEARIYLVDYEQHELRELAGPGSTPVQPLAVDGTVVGRVYRTQELVELSEAELRRLLIPLVDGSHRIGVLELCVPSDSKVPVPRWQALASLVADLVITKSAYGDTIDITRRRIPMAVRAEAQRSLLPPLTLITPRLLVTGMLVPSYEVAGDVFDYALNGNTLHFAILDAMGHSLSATLTATVAVSAYRNSRRRGGSLEDGWRTADEAVAAEFGGERFATAVFGELDLTTGRLRSMSAGHPAALVVRGNRVVARCADEPTLPVGLGGESPAITSTNLQPGDRLLLFTDGIVEARARSGEFFGEERLVDNIARELDTGLPAPEAVRRLVHAVGEHQSGKLRDDATLMLVEWRGKDKHRPDPATL